MATHDGTGVTRRDLFRVGVGAATAATAAGAAGPTHAQEEFDYGGWFEDANNYDGPDSIVDQTGTGELLIEVGPNRQYQFDPAAVRIDSGTTITWEWMSSNHSVTQTESSFDFEDSGTQSSGATHEQTLEGTGAFLYKCTPHANLGHYGGIIVE